MSRMIKRLLSVSIVIVLAVLSSCKNMPNGSSSQGFEGNESSNASSDNSSEDASVWNEHMPAELVFEDNFDGTTLDLTKWERCPEWDRQGDLCAWRNSMSDLDGEGNLRLRAVWDENLSKVLSGAIRSKGKFEYGFGYYEAKIKFPKAEGLWGAFWMMAGNVHSEKDGAKDGIEIDIVESIGNENGAFNSALHWDGYEAMHKSRSSGKLYSHDIYDGEYHTFSLLRTDKAYIFYVDGCEIWRMTSGLIDICDENGYMKLTVEAADFVGAGTASAIAALPAEMLVDYVRVYTNKP